MKAATPEALRLDPCFRRPRASGSPALPTRHLAPRCCLLFFLALLSGSVLNPHPPPLFASFIPPPLVLDCPAQSLQSFADDVRTSPVPPPREPPPARHTEEGIHASARAIAKFVPVMSRYNAVWLFWWFCVQMCVCRVHAVFECRVCMPCVCMPCGVCPVCVGCWHSPMPCLV